MKGEDDTKRISLRVTPESYDKAVKMARERGYKSVTAFAKAMFDFLMRERHDEDTGDLGEEVAGLFRECEQWQEDNGNPFDLNQRL